MVLAVIPAYQAERTIADVVVGVRAAGLGEVIVVDDGSRDATAGLAERAGARVLRHARNRGKGAALWTGFAAARQLGARSVLTLDADGQHDPAEIPRLLAAARASANALVVGARTISREAMPGRSRIGNHVSTFFLARFTGEPLSDSQSGFRVYPSALLERVTPRARRFDAETELLLGAVTYGHPVVEVAVRTIYQEGGRSHFRDVHDTMRIIVLVLGWLARSRRLPS
jgi:glycosyltransferase involved in cell wall biosynthesis